LLILFMWKPISGDLLGEGVKRALSCSVPAGCPLAEADARLTLEVSVMAAKQSARKRELAMAFFGWRKRTVY
jgi:hypothetical protein